MYNLNIIFILAIVILFTSSVNSQSCISVQNCKSVDQDCSIPNSKCDLGTYCGINPNYPKDAPEPSSSYSDGSYDGSFSPIPYKICLPEVKVNEPCLDGVTQCQEGTTCYGDDTNTTTCQFVNYLQYGEECSADQQCYQGLQCDAFQKICLPKLTDDQIADRYQCDMDEQCKWYEFCNTTNHRCLHRAVLGQPCKSYSGNLPPCLQGLTCESSDPSDLTGSMICTKYASKGLDAPCSSLSTFSGCDARQGLYCNLATSKCEAIPSQTDPSVNCTTDIHQCRTYFEECVCSAEGSSTGICKPKGNLNSYNQTQVTKCVQAYVDILECVMRTNSSASGNFLSPDSRLLRECPSYYCEYIDSCIDFNNAEICNPVDNPYDGYRYGSCALMNMSSRMMVVPSITTLMTIFIIFIINMYKF